MADIRENRRGSVKNNTRISGEWISGLIRDFISTSPENSMKGKKEEPAWEEALVGASNNSILSIKGNYNYLFAGRACFRLG